VSTWATADDRAGAAGSSAAGSGSGSGSIDGDWFGPFVPWIMLVCLLAIVVPRLVGSRSLAIVYAREPYLRVASFLALITWAIGWSVDSAGMLVPGMGLLFALPLAVSACALGLMRGDAPTAVETAGTAAASDPARRQSADQ
jgi:hypothetical protein